MTKKDTIVLAVLFNIVILVGVLTTARQLSTPAGTRQRGTMPLAAPTAVGEERELADQYVPQEEILQPFDEIDQLLEEYISEEPVDLSPAQVRPKDAKKNAATESKTSKGKQGAPSDEFYIIKPGDNPWKIAKKFHLSFEKLLQLNNLDEAKARNLKVGSRLRIREES